MIRTRLGDDFHNETVYAGKTRVCLPEDASTLYIRVPHAMQERLIILFILATDPRVINSTNY